MDYLRLIWIVDYSGPRGAAWPRVSISEPLARAHLRLPLLLCLRSSLVLDPRYQTSLERPPFPSCFLSLAPSLLRFLTGCSPLTRGSFSRRSSSVPTRRLGLRPITCLPVIRCCANLPSSVYIPIAPVSRANSLCVLEDSKPGESPTSERICNNHQPYNRPTYNRLSFRAI